MVAVAPVAVSGVVSNMTITSLSSSAPPMTAHTSTVPVCSTTATDCGGSTEMVPTEERERERERVSGPCSCLLLKCVFTS